MPQVDIETLVSACAAGGGDAKIACKTLSDGDAEQPPAEVAENQTDPPPDFPPESFWLSKDAEYDWFDRNAFYERKESLKPNSVSSSNNLNQNQNSNSQRFSGNLMSKAAFVGLPKTQKASYVDTAKRRNCKPPKLFPKRSGSVGKSAAEPSSPKVSCMGRVRSKRGRRKSTEPATKSVKSFDAERTERRSIGICGFLGIFRSNRRTKSSITIGRLPPVESPPRRSSVREFPESREFSASFEPESDSEPPGLGGMKRFVSGRRSTSFADDVA